MAVNDANSAWAKDADKRAKVAAMIAGRDEAVAYVTGMPGWEGDMLKAIRDRAYFLPMVGRTIETFTGLIFLKAPARQFPEGLEDLTNDVTGSGQEIDRFAEAGYDSVMGTGAIAVLVDMERAPEGLTRAQAEAMGLRPFLRLYDANSILEARIEKRGPMPQLVRVRLKEQIEEEAPATVAALDPFATVVIDQVRVLELIDGVYQQTVWRKEYNEIVYKAGDPVIPTQAGKPLDHIPCHFSNTRDGEARPEKPPVADLADINVSHLNNSASLEWTLMWLGSPILFGAGIKMAAGSVLTIGASEAVMAQDPTAKLTVVQASSDSVSAISGAMKDKERHAAAMGARMLSEETKQVLAAETARIQRAGEASVVGAAANAVSQCLTNALAEMARWAGLPDTVTVPGKPIAPGKTDADTTEPMLYWLSTDALPSKLTAQELTALLGLVNAGKLTNREFYALLQESEYVDPAKTFSDHEEEAAAEEPPPPTAAELAAALAGSRPAPGGPPSVPRRPAPPAGG